MTGALATTDIGAIGAACTVGACCVTVGVATG